MVSKSNRPWNLELEQRFDEFDRALEQQKKAKTVTESTSQTKSPSENQELKEFRNSGIQESTNSATPPFLATKLDPNTTPPQQPVEPQPVPMSRSHAVFDQMGKNMAQRSNQIQPPNHLP